MILKWCEVYHAIQMLGTKDEENKARSYCTQKTKEDSGQDDYKTERETEKHRRSD
jgi:hypothetical protein